MTGDDVGSLLVYQQDEGDSFVSPSWQKNGNQGDIWRLGTVTISPSQIQRFRVRKLNLHILRKCLTVIFVCMTCLKGCTELLHFSLQAFLIIKFIPEPFFPVNYFLLK